MADMNGTVGERLARAMAARGLKQAALSRDSKVGQPAISRLLRGERGKQPKPETFGRLAHSLNVPVAWLLLGVGPDPFSPEQVAASVLTPNGGGRYGSRLSAGTSMRGILDDRAIESMLIEEYSGLDKDPGADFWIERARWYHERRKLVAGQVGARRTALYIARWGPLADSCATRRVRIRAVPSAPPPRHSPWAHPAKPLAFCQLEKNRHRRPLARLTYHAALA